VKHNVECVFTRSQRPQQKRKRVKEQALTDRLKQYEAVLQAQGIDPAELPDTPISEPSSSLNKAQVVHGQGRFKFVDK
jgi:hypothetical protein